MPSVFQNHIQFWRQQTDIDFFHYYMKVWLAFNAWMCYSTGEKKDRDNIDRIKDNSNQFTKEMVSLIEGADNKCVLFKEHISNLHIALQSSQLLCNKDALTFENAFIGKNPELECTDESLNVKYSVVFNNRNNNQHNILVRKDTIILLDITNDKYDLNWLREHREFLKLTRYRQNTILSCYHRANPKLYKNLIKSTGNDSNKIQFGNISFINDVGSISKGLIEMLYRLRCILFHGELAPDKDSKKVYEHAYFVLKMLIDNLFATINI